MSSRTLPVVVAFTSLAALVTSASPVLAWGNEGHRIVCEIALKRLSPAGQTFLAGVRALESDIEDPFEDCQNCSPGHPSDGRPMSFLDGCLWPDESRRDTFRDTYENHFINVPQAATGFDLLRDCGMFDCALVGIQRFGQYLAKEPSTSSRERERRALALRFLSHSSAISINRCMSDSSRISAGISSRSSSRRTARPGPAISMRSGTAPS
jgi:hypothetical protein